MRGLVKSRVEFAAREFPRGLRQGGNMAALPLARSRIPPATQATSLGQRGVTKRVREFARLRSLLQIMPGCQADKRQYGDKGDFS